MRKLFNYLYNTHRIIWPLKGKKAGEIVVAEVCPSSLCSLYKIFLVILWVDYFHNNLICLAYNSFVYYFKFESNIKASHSENDFKCIILSTTGYLESNINNLSEIFKSGEILVLGS